MWYYAIMDTETNVKDSQGTILLSGDTVQVIKDLKIKGSSITIKKGTLVKGIKLTDDEEEVECRVDNMKGIILRTEFLRKKN